MDEQSFLIGKKIFSTKWNQSTVRDILTNKSYTGETVIFNKNIYSLNSSNNIVKTNDEKTEDNWIHVSFPRIIDVNLFNDAQARIKHNRIAPKRTSECFSGKLLTIHMLRCGECGAKLLKQVQTKSDKIYYTCYWRKSVKKKLELEDRKKCNLPYYDYSVIDKHVYAKIIDFITNPKEFEKLFKKTIGNDEILDKINHFETVKNISLNEIRRFSSMESTANDEDLFKIYKEKREIAEENFRNIKIKLTYYKNRLLFINKNNEQINNFKKIFSLNSFGDVIKAKIKIKKLLLDLSFDKKKKLIDAVISPETGGCVYVRRFSESDLSPHDIIVGTELPLSDDDHEILHASSEKSNSRNEDIVIELDFLLDPYKHSLIIQDIYKNVFKIDGL